MASSKPKLVPVVGSELPAQFTAKAVGRANAIELITVTVKVRAKNDKGSADGLHALAMQAVKNRSHVSREEFGAAHGADPADLKKVEDYARACNLNVVESCTAKRRVVLAGKVSDFESAFGVTLERFEHPGGTFRSYTSSVHVPPDLEPIVEAVLGLSNRPAAKPHFQARRRANPLAGMFASADAPQPLTPLQVAQLYDFPTGLDGSGQSIAIIELGGGFTMADLNAYFTGLGLPTPSVSAVSVLGASNTPVNDPNSADGEVMLDIEVAGAVAPQSKIVVYFAPNTTQGFVTAITNAAHDTVNAPSVISISWGGPESTWRASERTAMTNAIRDAGLMGVTVTVASGDNGSADGLTDRRSHVDFPASSPFALACGGTRLEGTLASISEEVVWNDGPNSATGGGVSDSFPQPAYQKNAHVPKSVNPGHFAGRGVPDVAGNADPESGYEVRVDGLNTVIGGTSAVAPLWAGLIALLNQSLGKPVGFLNPLLYSQIATGGGLHDVTVGNNGSFKAGKGWDPCTGLGSPDGAKILSLLGGTNGAATVSHDGASKKAAAAGAAVG
ncbi:S53 family peptidase [Paludisphaera borealis]|uniref:Pseudomonalisin n=1 Tax=Paludisphaera borealis TaxID=1387353 RepID=A0A1U7CJH8_9BACT|nr:S53 family peptidase [Paludisphaera borealis]APW59091.1 Pseudomonalisin [Paludisphaera borealis]